MLGDTQFPRMLMSDVVHDRLLAEIITGDRAAGVKLSPDSLAADFGVSRTPIREAINRLAGAGFIDVTRNARTQVSRWGVGHLTQRLRLLTIVAASVLDGDVDLGPLATFHPGSQSAHRGFLKVCNALIAANYACVGDAPFDDAVIALTLYLDSQPTAPEPDVRAMRDAIDANDQCVLRELIRETGDRLCAWIEPRA